MKQRSRKAAGTLLMLAFLVAYALVIMAIGGELVTGRGIALELAFFAAAGLLWLPVAMAIIRWMMRPDSG